jgi:hypothetical protein
LGILICALGFSTFSCQKKTEVSGISLEIGFSEPSLTDNLITDMKFTWKIGKDFVKLTRDLNVFVHFWHKQNLLFQDDYVPEVPTSQWEAGKEYVFNRRVYIPTFIDEFDPQFKGEEKLRLSIGLYSPFDRTGKIRFEIFLKELKVSPPPVDTPEVVYEEGWYDLENNPEAYLKQWRWTSKEGRCIIDNPRRDALLVIKGGVNLEATKDQKVIIRINDLVLDEFAPTESYFDKSYNVKKEMLGDKDDFYLTITADKTFIPAKIDPASQDQRELGVAISFLYFR